MLTYMLWKTQSILLSATSRKGQPDADLQTFQNQEHALVNKQETYMRWSLTICSKDLVSSKERRTVSQLQSVQNQEYVLFSSKHEEPARSLLTTCSKPRACSCQKQGRKAAQVVTYILFKTQCMLLSEKNRKGQPSANLHPVQNPEHAIVSNIQEGLPRS